jgi:uncharacterized 2Fe-2S/4Fe-4S cluster protein (DUF4445 family)
MRAGKSSRRALFSPAGDEKLRLLGRGKADAGWRFSCLARFPREGTVTVEGQERSFFLPGEDPGGESAPAREGPLCAAVDIGTTTVAGALAEIDSGRIVVRAAEANRQRSYGFDVVSRIENAVRSPEKADAMRRLIRAQVGGMLAGICRAADGARPERVHICGNTTMLHLWEGTSLAGLSRMPFQPAFLEARESWLDSGDGPGFHCRLLPMISAFIGADIAAGILACGLDSAAACPELLVDIGTNGEIVLAAEGRLLATATAAGPAFEGGRISCGIPAVEGAVDHVAWRDGKFPFTVLGNLPPAGICGSGLLDLLACLRRAGLMDAGGGLAVAPDPAGVQAFQLPSDPPLRLTQADIRQLQLAKGAVAAGIRVLCRHAGVPLAEVGKVHLAGAFGSHLSADSALAAGLIPQELAGSIEPAGNTALAGALMTARDPALLDRIERIAPTVRVLDLSREPGFQDAFVNAMRFPELIG